MKKWLLISLGVICVLLILVFSTTNLGTHISNFTEVYADDALHKDAMALANKNEEVSNIFGKISLKDNLSLLNGDVQYSEDHKKVELTFKFKGTKENGVMDVMAHRNAEIWEYDLINLRGKDSLRIEIE